MKFLRNAAWCAGLGAWAASAWAQVSPTTEAPSSTPATPAATAVSVAEPGPEAPFAATGVDADIASSVQLKNNINAGRYALELGEDAQAVGFFQDALKQPDLDDATKDGLNLDLATAYLAQDLVGPAAAALKAVSINADNSPSYLLRSALLSARNLDWAGAAAQIAQVNSENLSPTDRPWYYGVQALIAENNKNATAAAADWKNAEDLSASPLQKAQFELALQRGQLLLTPAATLDLAQSLEASSRNNSIPSIAAQYAQRAAIVYDLLGQHDKAISLVSQWLVTLPDADHEDKNAMRLLFAEINEEDPAAANPAREQEVLQQVLLDHLDAAAPGQPSLLNSQEIALFMLFRNAKADADRQAFVTFLDSLLNPPASRPLPEPMLIEQVYLLKAQLLFDLRDLDVKNQDLASAAAQVLADKYRPAPGASRDPSYEDALRLLAYIATQSKPPQFRVAANNLNTLLKSLPNDDPESKAMLGLVADLEFSAGDFSPAADSYISLLKDPAPLVPRGTLLWRAVLSELSISPPNTAAAIALLDEYANRTDIDVNSRSMAEWNVLMNLCDNGHEAEAFARLKNLLNPAAGQVAPPTELRLRLLWMGAHLAVDLAEPPVAVEQAAAFKDAIEAITPQEPPEISPALRDDLMASALLFSGEAAYRANLPADEEKYFTTLREDYKPGDAPEYSKATEAAVYSLIFEANTLYAGGHTQAAWGKMNDLTDNYPKSPYAPLATFKSAVYADALDKTDQAIEILEKFITSYPDAPLMFEAQLLLAENYYKSGQFSKALERYQGLEIKIPPDNPLAADAAMGEAYCLYAEAARNGDPDSREKAREALERLVALTSLPVDARVEAGFRLGKLLENGDAQGNNRELDRAAKVYFDIQSQFLNGNLAQSPKGEFWMGLCMESLEEIYVQDPKLGDAGKIAGLIKQYNLPSALPAAAGTAPPATTTPSASAPVSGPPPNTPASAPASTPVPSPAPAGDATGAPTTHTTN
jgi:outer membrane protein assembly factor BamD (BamD/ComL family)